ncbi:hypothetical protein [Phenylobacterium sp.]|uniref:hypothetical protein n=1 Tax=Phenylobacterium sp. TaxID=1871053 RepID=UPI0027341D6C|nr:hypothetical protein [Phenylobacterium sp.]MDP3660436.1 hypothetical protein [Phenylobacterium sp.]
MSDDKNRDPQQQTTDPQRPTPDQQQRQNSKPTGGGAAPGEGLSSGVDTGHIEPGKTQGANSAG